MDQAQQPRAGMQPVAPRFLQAAGIGLLLLLGGCADGDFSILGGNATLGPAPALGGPTRLHNLSGNEIVALLGEPGFKREENPAQVWRYRSESCVLELILYRSDRDLQVRHVEARDDRFRAVQYNACIESVTASRQRPLRSG